MRPSASSCRRGTRRRGIGPLLAAVVGAPGVAEVIVVDDESTDGTAALAAAPAAPRSWPASRSRTGGPARRGRCSRGWTAASGEWVVFLDADTRPSPELPGCARGADGRRRPRRAHRRRALRLPDGAAALAAPGAADHARLPQRPARRHPSRAGAPADGQRSVHRRPARARCSAPAAGGPSPTTPSRTSRSCGRWRRPASPSPSSMPPTCSRCGCTSRRTDAWRGWGRSLSLPGVESLPRRVGRLGIVASPRRRRCCGCSPAAATCSTRPCSPSASARSPGPPARTSAAASPTGSHRPPTSPPPPRSPLTPAVAGDGDRGEHGDEHHRPQQGSRGEVAGAVAEHGRRGRR